MSQSLRVSLILQDLASGISDVLKETAGEELAFVLLVSADNTAQYVSNASREDGKALIVDLLGRWNANRADIPAHYNPDLKGHEALRREAYAEGRKDERQRCEQLCMAEQAENRELAKGSKTAMYDWMADGAGLCLGAIRSQPEKK